MSGSESDKKIIIFCDGACSGNPGPGGWGSILFFPEGSVTELGGGLAQTTNNQMELMAAIRALEKITDLSYSVLLYSDSNYVVKGMKSWIYGWIKNNWRTGEGKDVANQELWKQLYALSQARGAKNIDWVQIPAHSGISGNERVDEIAVAFSKSLPVELYEGKTSEYSVSSEVTAQTNAKKITPFYLSFVDGVVGKHKTWAECEKRVKGMKNAKFKKVSLSSEEASTLKSWGLYKDE